MAKFCIHCGKELKDGEICNCQDNVKVESALGNSLLEIIKGMFVKPIDTIKENGTKENFNLGLILSGSFALALALFTLSLVKNAYSTATGMMGASYYSLSSVYSVEIPYFKIFIITLLAAAALVFIFTGLLYLVNSVIFKGEKDYKKLFTIYSVNSVIVTIALLLSAIFMFVHVALGVIILCLGMILNMVYLYKSIEFMGVSDENKHGYIYLLTTVFYFIVIFIICKMFS